MSKSMLKKVLSLAVVSVASFLVSESYGGDKKEAASAEKTAVVQTAQSFVTYDQFCKARSLHVTSRMTSSLVEKASCYIENSVDPSISMVIKRALKLHGMPVVADKASARYVVNVSFAQSAVRNRTYTTMHVSFSENKAGQPVAWIGTASLSARGAYNAGEYALSMTGGIMYYFNKFVSQQISRRTLHVFYHQLVAVGE